MKQNQFWDVPCEPVRISRSRNGRDRERKLEADRRRYATEYIRKKHRGWCKEYYQKNRDQILAKQEAWRAVNKDRLKEYMQVKRFKKYGLTKERWEEIFEAQGLRCGICGTMDFGKPGPHTDHCHVSGRVRGILCQHCNHLLGACRDSPDILAVAIRYLQQNAVCGPSSAFTGHS